MKAVQKPILLFVVFVCVFSMLAVPVPALAQFTILSVQPNTVLTTSSVDLVVTGTEFADGAVVVLENFGALATTFVSTTVLRATLPAGVAPGVYTITVVNPDSTSVSLANALTVLEPTATLEPPTPTTQAEPTSTPASTRPLIVIDSYSTNVSKILPGKEFNLSIKLKNVGGRSATSLVAVFTPGELIPRESGGVLAVPEIDPGEKERIIQPLTASADISGKTMVTLVMQVSYTDSSGGAYTETFNLTLPISAPVYVAGPTATPTPTPTAAAIMRPQLVISGYTTDVDILQPGSRFTLQLDIQNLGNLNAKRVTLILGGGSSSGGSSGGTPEVGGVSGASGDFGNFAPVAASNVQYLGDLDKGSASQASAALIVNATTNPGAYPMKITFAYTDEKGNIYNDDQVITLLVYSLPLVEINFYREPDPLFAGQPGMLPLQVVNLARKTALLGNMRVTAQGATFSNNVLLIGALDLGGYYTLDATVIPDMPGPLQLLVSIDYTDDFNMPQVITRTFDMEVQEMIMPEPGPGGLDGNGEIPPVLEPETFLQKVWRFIRGLIGLDSSIPTPQPGEIFPEDLPSEEMPPVKSVPVSPKG